MRSKLQKLADTFSDWRATGFARQNTRNVALFKARGESFSLCGLSASLRSLERDERQPRHLPIVKQSGSNVERAALACPPEPQRRRRIAQILLPAGKRILRDQINQGELCRSARDDKPVLRYTDEKLLAGETRAVFVFVV